MSSMNLIPNITIVAVQAGIFVSTFLVVRKTMLEPYLMVRRRRHEMTFQKKEEAIQVLRKNEEQTNRVQAEINQVTTKTKLLRDDLKREALKERDRILLDAQKSAENRIETTKKEIREELLKEREKIPQIVDKLTKELYEKAIC